MKKVVLILYLVLLLLTGCSSKMNESSNDINVEQNEEIQETDIQIDEW